jgi:hypothetical protein
MTNEINVNQDVVLLPSATRNGGGNINSADQDNPYWRGCVIYLNITQSSGTGGLKLVVQFKDPASGNYYGLWSDPTVHSAVGTYVAILYPSPNLSLDGTGGAVLPRTWRVQIQPQDSSSYTYSVGCSMLK